MKYNSYMETQKRNICLCPLPLGLETPSECVVGRTPHPIDSGGTVGARSLDSAYHDPSRLVSFMRQKHECCSAIHKMQLPDSEGGPIRRWIWDCSSLGGSRRKTRKPKKQSPPESLETECESSLCANMKRLGRKARKIVKLLKIERGLKPVMPVPKKIACGSLRKRLRAIYPKELDPVLELSIKTSMKCEPQPCDTCMEPMVLEAMSTYEKARLKPVDVSDEHLDSFERAFAENVPDGWDKRRSAYVPNGAATLMHSRSQGGNWNSEEFTDQCRKTLVFSKGKPRIVTMYSSYNVAVLTPLHHSLYSHLKGRTWLLVGDPTSERLAHLEEGCLGSDWLSFDYEAATDNIKSAYVERAVEVLIAKGTLSEDEERCLRAFATLSLEGGRAQSGQPMGSPMSFPVLCLINKTVVDMALSNLLKKGKISFKEWTSHRCLVNGDDLLTKETEMGGLVQEVQEQGGHVGLKVNEEKTMQSPIYAEINSTLFSREAKAEDASGVGREDKKRKMTLQKKTNVSALWMSSDVRDVLGFAGESTVSGPGFRMCVVNNASRLSRQKIKTFAYILPVHYSQLIADPALRRLLCSTPDTSVPDARNLFEVESKPVGFEMSPEEVSGVMTTAVNRVRETCQWMGLHQLKRSLAKKRKSVTSSVTTKPTRLEASRILSKRNPPSEEKTLSCLASAWKYKRKEVLLAEDMAENCHHLSAFTVFDGESCSPWVQIQSKLNKWKNNKKECSPRLSGDCPGSDETGNEGFIRFGSVACDV